MLILWDCRTDFETDLDHGFMRNRNLKNLCNKLGFLVDSTDPIIESAESITLPRFNFRAAADCNTMERISPSLASAKRAAERS